MTDGKTHERYLRKGWILILPLAFVLFVGTQNIIYPTLLCLNFGLCEFLDPDADQLGLTKSEGDVLRTAKRFRVGLLGAFWIAWWFIYAYITGVGSKTNRRPPKLLRSDMGRAFWTVYRNTVGLFRGHRSRASHSLIIGTGLRMVWFNLPIFITIYIIASYSMIHYWPNTSHMGLWRATHWNMEMGIWLVPYLVTQFIAWTVGDAIHLWADDMLFYEYLPDRWRFPE